MKEQIKELEIDLLRSITRSTDNGEIRLGDTARNLYGNGWRKQSEVAREIFAEIYEDCFDQFGYIDYEALASLKKKYTEDQT